MKGMWLGYGTPVTQWQGPVRGEKQMAYHHPLETRRRGAALHVGLLNSLCSVKPRSIKTRHGKKSYLLNREDL